MTALQRSFVFFGLALMLVLGGLPAQGDPAADPAAGIPAVLLPGTDLKPKTFDEWLDTQTPERLEALAKLWVDHVQEIAEGEEAGQPDLVSLESVVPLAGRAVTAFESVGGDAAVVDKYRKFLARAGGDAFANPLGIVSKAKDWLLDPEGGIEWGINLVLFLVVVIAFRILGAIVGRLIRKALAKFKKGSQLLLDFFANTASKLIFFVGLMIGLGILGVPTGPFIAALGAAGFIIGFALQGTLSNFAAGIMILLYRPYDIGDFVQIAGVSGTVKAMSLVSTTLATPDNQVVVVPNGSIWGDVITNVTGNATRRVDLVFGIGYDDDTEKAKAILADVVGRHEKVLAEPAPVIQVHELADSSVNLVCRPWVATSDYWSVYWDLTHAVKRAFDEADVTIPFPQRDLHVYQQSSSA